ncbi:MAG: type I DNA topoisomerase [Oscillospiraceae bacterium]|nr:type I DNA topoisomerase [Oscillospiraceae bacterium]
MSYLVIVESPTKVKTIGKNLGSKYKVMASMGHLRDLPKSDIGIDIEGGFVPKYLAIRGKSALIRELKSLAADADAIYLATDPDREGEAISWHLKELLELDEKKTKRVTFNEITKNAILEGIKKPRDIDENLVNAQQARRLLDRIVGYKLSPLLWKKVRYGLSAGRVQSVATRLVIDRENEIREFVPREFWTIDADFSRLVPGFEKFTAKFHGTDTKKIEPASQEETDSIIESIKDADFFVKSIKRAEKKRSPVPPFITSTLQQEASRRFGMTPSRTMTIAQQLYEGVEVDGMGLTGLITYMRTDSLRLADEAIYAVRNYITETFGESYCPKTRRVFKTKKSAQDAHEAIRPAYVELTPEKIKKNLTPDQYKLYRIIWSRFVACQMESAVYDTMAVDIAANKYIFRATSSKIAFKGYTAVYSDMAAEQEEQAANLLPELSENEKLKFEGKTCEQHFTTPPARYTDGSLIKAMEEKGVGRPSTYAPTISTILDREYVVKEGKSLKPTPLGEVVNGLMVEQFSDIIDVEFTAHMEQQLDEVETGSKDWKKTLSDFYGPFAEELEKAEEALEGKRLKVPDEVTDIVCELCGRNMVVKSGRFGKFLACPGFPECKNTKAIVEKTPGECPVCGGEILKKKSKNGYWYYGCEKFPECTFMTWDVPQKEKCEVCGKTMYKRSGRGSKKIFCANPDCERYEPQEYKAKSETSKKSSKKTTKKASSAKKTATKKTSSKKSAEKK